MAKITNKIDVVLAGRGALTLRPNDHVATGGEGSVYRKSNTIIKLYTNVRKMMKDDFARKIKILSKLKHKFVVTPTNVVLNTQGDPIGFYMQFVKGEPLSRVFTNDFRKRENFDDDNASTLVSRMREVVQFAHDNKAILVDANEMNWLAKVGGKNGSEPRAIDVDSWAIDRWGASVIMPSIRDWHTNGFDERTDWFAWGVVTFQVYTGIHPYKGKLQGYKPNEMEKRMKSNASVFAKNVRLNRAVRDFSTIPGPLLDWYESTFEQGSRSVPPSPFDKGNATVQINRVLHVVSTASGNLIFDKIYNAGSDEVLRVFPCGIALLRSGKLVLLYSGRDIADGYTSNVEVVRVEGGWLSVDYVEGQLQFRYINSVSLQIEELALAATLAKVVRYENRLFGITQKGLTEIVVKVLGKPILALSTTWGVLINSTKWFDGVGIQDAMGAMYVIAPFGSDACAQVRVRELDGLRVVNARAGNRFVTIIAIDKNGEYQKLELAFDKQYQSYKAWQSVVDSPDLNIAILPKRVCATIVDDGRLDIFVPSNGTLNTVEDKFISADMILANWDDKVVYNKDGDIWQVRLK